MAYNSAIPADTQTIAGGPSDMRTNFEGLRTGQVVDAGTLKGLTTGNATGNIPVANGTVCTNLNAEKVGGNLPSAFATAGHTHAVATTSSNGLMANTDKTKLDGIASGAEVNQSAWSNILVGATTIQADSDTDTLALIAGTNIVLTPDATNDAVTIGVTGTVALATSAGTCTGNSVTSTNATNHISDTAGAHAATAISCTATGNIAATTVQAAIAELEAEKLDSTDTATVATANKLLYLNASGVLPASITGNAPTATNATTAGGLAVNSTGVNNVANQIVRTNASGFAVFGTINTNQADTTTAATSYFVETGGDGYIRPKSLANVKTELGITALESNLIKEVVLTVASSDISATSLGMAVDEAYEYKLMIPSSAVLSYISLYADGDTVRANYSSWLDTVGNGTGIAYIGYKAANNHTILEGTLQLTSGMPAMIMGRCYRSNGFLTQVAWNTNATKSTIGTLLFRCTDSGLATTVVGFPIGTTLRIYKKK